MEQLQTIEEFKKLINDHNYVVIDFYADWCGPCKMLSPIMHEVEQEKSNIVFAKVNVDQAMDLAELFGVMSIPMVVYIKNQKKALSEVGFKPKSAILENIHTIFE